MTRRRHALDLLPLLDVFMVVLFVFATIQEQQLDASAHEATALRSRLAALEQAEAPQRAAQAASAAAEREARAALERSQQELAELRAAVEEVRRAAEKAAAEGDLDGAEALRRREVLAKLLDHFSVFEIEVDGALVDGAVVNRCCYRAEPLPTAWRACGELPATSTELREWLAEGGAGLVEALRRTKGGNAMTIVRQNERATWQVARKLAGLLKERFAEHKIYDESAPLHSLDCAAGR